MRLKILQIFNRYFQYGGEEGSVYRIGDALQEIHDVEYFLGSSKDLFEGGLFKKALVPINSIWNANVIRRLRKYQAMGHFDIWQIHNVFVGLSPAVYKEAFRMGIPIVHYLQNYRFGCIKGSFIREGKSCHLCTMHKYGPGIYHGCWRDSSLMSAWMALLLEYSYSLGLMDKVAAWVVLSNIQKTRYVEMGFPKDRISVIPHFYSASKNSPLPTTQRNVLFIGRLSPEKGVDRLLHAWKLVGRKDAKLFIVGEGPEREKLEEICTDNALSNVVFTGFLNKEKQYEIWEKVLFTVVPSIWEEPFGMVVLESWNYARAVLATNLGAFPETIGDSIGGQLFDADDLNDLATKISHWLDNPAEAISAGQAGRKRLETNFSKEVWLSNASDIYQKVYNK